MKVLSVKQPWAWLICSDIKNIENRTWKIPEKMKGQRVLIHASSSSWVWNKVLKYINQMPEVKAFFDQKKYTGTWLRHLQRGAIIGSVEIVDCVVNNESIWAEKTELSTAWGEHIPIIMGKVTFNWVLANPVLFDKPIENVKGKLNFWEYEMSDEEYNNLITK